MISGKFLLAILLVLQSAQYVLAQDDGGRACVSLLEYKHRDCAGDPITTRNHTVWTQPGSGCRHDDKMGDNSITNEYCTALDTDKPIYHQRVYVKSKSCKVPWYAKAYSPQHLTYDYSKCTYGYKLNACTPGPCENESVMPLESAAQEME